jgi:hypothetical protein
MTEDFNRAAIQYNFNFEDLYQPIEYIESTGTQYINTNFIDTLGTKISIDLQFNTLLVQQRLFGHGYDVATTTNVSFEAYINGDTQWSRATKDGVGN